MFLTILKYFLIFQSFNKILFTYNYEIKLNFEN